MLTKVCPLCEILLMNIHRGRRCLVRDVICSQICRSETSCREALAGVLLGSFAMVGSQGREGKMETTFATSQFSLKEGSMIGCCSCFASSDVPGCNS